MDFYPTTTGAPHCTQLITPIIIATECLSIKEYTPIKLYCYILLIHLLLLILENSIEETPMLLPSKNQVIYKLIFCQFTAIANKHTIIS